MENKKFTSDRDFIKEIAMINKAHIGFLGMSYLYHNIKEPKITRPRAKALINYIYKNRMKHYKRNPFLSYKHLRFARHLNESDTITGGKTMEHKSSAFISTTQSASNSYEPVSMKAINNELVEKRKSIKEKLLSGENVNMNDSQNMDYRIKAYEEYGATGKLLSQEKEENTCSEV